jgi:phosphomethylpyrimidine synthase
MNKEEKSQEHVSKFDKDLCLRRNSPIKVAMREISQDDTKMSNGRIEKKIRPLLFTTRRSLHRSKYWNRHSKGLPRIREQWILDRNDVEELSEISSEYGKERLNDVKLNDLVSVPTQTDAR